MSHFPRDSAPQPYGAPTPVPDYGYSPWASDEPEPEPMDQWPGHAVPAPMPYAQAAPEPAFQAPIFQLAAPGEAAFQQASPGQTFESSAGPATAPAMWQPAPQQTPMSAYPPGKYQATPYIASYYNESKRSRSGFWLSMIAGVLILAGVAGFLVVNRTSPVRTTLPSGSGVAAGDSTTPADGPGAVYTSARGHFAYRSFNPQTIQEASDAGSDRGIDYTTYTVADVSVRGVIMGGVTSVSLTKGEAEAFLRAGASDSGTGPDPITDVKLTTTSFRGRPALRGSLVQDGAKLYVVFVMYGTERFYVIAAGSSAALATLEKSFVALP